MRLLAPEGARSNRYALGSPAGPGIARPWRLCGAARRSGGGGSGAAPPRSSCPWRAVGPLAPAPLRHPAPGVEQGHVQALGLLLGDTPSSSARRWRSRPYTSTAGGSPVASDQDGHPCPSTPLRGGLGLDDGVHERGGVVVAQARSS